MALFPQHLSEDECLAYVQHTLTDERRAALDVHVDACEKCTLRIARLIDEGEVPLAAPGSSTEISERGRLAILRELVATSPKRESLRAVTDATVRGLVEAGDRVTRRELLNWAGRTPSLNELLVESGAPRETTQRLLRELPGWLVEERPGLLAEAEQAARAVIGEAFERWRQGGGSVEDDESDAIKQHAAASGPIRFSQPHRHEPDYSLVVHETQHGSTWFTSIRCVGPNPKRRFAYRMTFEPRDESAALSVLGLSPERLGALRVSHALDPQRWTALLDLLLPCRYGSAREGEESPFARPLKQGGVPGRLPGQPVRIHFWLLD